MTRVPRAFVEADRKARADIEFHRQAMAAIGRVRAEAVRELRKTKSVREIAADMGVTRQEVYRLLRSKHDRPSA